MLRAYGSADGVGGGKSRKSGRGAGNAKGPNGGGGGGGTDPYWANVVFLSLMTGTNGGTVFTDSSGRHTLTAAGNAQTSTAQSIGTYGSSGLFDGAGDYVYTTNSPDFDLFGKTDFTIEAWIRPDAVASTMCVCGNRDFTLGKGINLDIFSNGTFWIVGITGFGSPINTIQANVWQHLAFSRTGGVDTLYHDGVCVASQASITDEASISPEFRIGDRSNGLGPFDGYIGPVRYTNGVARYVGTSIGTTYFSPPTNFPTS